MFSLTHKVSRTVKTLEKIKLNKHVLHQTLKTKNECFTSQPQTAARRVFGEPTLIVFARYQIRADLRPAYNETTEPFNGHFRGTQRACGMLLLATTMAT